MSATPATNAILELTPPPGPLAWLHPEVLALHAMGEKARSDATSTLFGDALVEQARRSTRVRVEDGPRGASARRFLRERLRTLAPDLVVELDAARPSLERRLARGEPVGAVPWLAIDPSRAEVEIEAALRSFERADARLEATSGRPLAPIPFFRTTTPSSPPPLDPSSLAAGSTRVHTRLAATWFGLLPGDHFPDRLRALWHELLRALHPDRFLHALALEDAALAGFDLYDDVVRDRGAPLVEVRSPRARIVVFEGMDGAGKSSHCARLKERLEARGLRVAVHKLFRHGLFHETVTDLVRQCDGGENLHLWPLQRVVKAFDSLRCFFAQVEPDLARCDVVLFDRWTPTHLAEAIGRCHHDPWSRELLASLPRPDVLFLLDLPESDALARIAQRPTRTVDENAYMLGRWRAALLALARRDGHVVLDARAPFDENERRVVAEVDRRLAERRA